MTNMKSDMTDILNNLNERFKKIEDKMDGKTDWPRGGPRGGPEEKGGGGQVQGDGRVFPEEGTFDFPVHLTCLQLYKLWKFGNADTNIVPYERLRRWHCRKKSVKTISCLNDNETSYWKVKQKRAKR